MPGDILNPDTYFPDLTAQKSPERKFAEISDYLYMLLESLRYSFGNLGAENFNSAGLEELGRIIADPVYVQLTGEGGKLASLIYDVEGLSSRMTDAEGHVSVLQQSAEMNTAKISDLEGNISSLTQTSETLSARVSSNEGSISAIAMTVGSMTLSVTNGAEGSLISLTKNGIAAEAQYITFTGMVKFSDLSTAGSTVITGDNITTGTIKAIDLYTLLDGNGTVNGQLTMCYLNYSYICGGIRLDDQGAGTVEEGQYRMFLYTQNGFNMKLQSAANMSLSAAGIYMNAVNAITIFPTAYGGVTTIGSASTTVNLLGTVYVNGQLLTV